ncbi:MAG TPA: glycerate kinase [Tepidisphaeraceae bacterium]|jgi:glycerate kinase|nr:glycerate kinase [Tepidisphaeraceae bacterium]
MKILIAPDKFKGSLTASQVATAIATGLDLPPSQLDLCPLADGGEGTVHALTSATNGTLHTLPVTGPLPSMTISATYGILGSSPKTAVIEMSAAAGLALLPPHLRNPLHTTTFGVGQLILHAHRSGASHIILGIGGSATTDAGVACAQACGAKVFLNTPQGPRQLLRPFTGSDLPSFHSISPIPLPNLHITVACDVTNPLFGPTGAAHIFSPQKGATPPIVDLLDQGLQHLAAHTNPSLANLPGAGAAGGLGFAMAAFFHAELLSGIDIVLSAVHFSDRLRSANLCITGEGHLDEQSLSGKTPLGVTRACRQANVPCIALVGQSTLTPAQAQQAGFSRIECIGPNLPIPDRIAHAESLLIQAARSLKSDLPNLCKTPSIPL